MQKDVTNNSRIGDFFRYGIFSPPTVTYDPLLLLLNHHDREERDRLTEKWKDNKLQELNFVGVVSALLANVLTSTGSWPNLLPPGTTTPWFVRTCWFCGIVFGIASVLTAADQTIRLHRLSSHKNGLALMRHSLRSEKRDDDGSFRPRAIQVYTWQLSVLFLVGSALCLLLGLFLLVWSAMLEAVNGGKGFDENGYVSETRPIVSCNSSIRDTQQGVVLIYMDHLRLRSPSRRSP